MAEFFTTFSVDPTKESDEFIELAVLWVKGMERSKAKLEIENLVEDQKLAAGDELVLFKKVSYEESELIGFRYEYLDQGIRWRSEIVGNRKLDDFFVTIRVTRSTETALPSLPSPRRPFIVKLFLRNNWKVNDRNIFLTEKPIYLKDGEEETAYKFISGEFGNQLPIVYVSVSNSGDRPYYIDAVSLSKTLAGLAHVLVEPSQIFSRRLGEISNKFNVFNGTVGVYWPFGHGRKLYNPHMANLRGKSFEDEIGKDIILALANRRTDPDCSWNRLEELISRNKIEELKRTKSDNVSDYVNAFDAELNAMRASLQSANDEIARLNRLAQQNAKTSNNTGSSIVLNTTEDDFFDDEIKSLVITSLDNYKRISDESTRRYHIADDIIRSNAIKENITPDEIKQCLNDYKGLDQKTRSKLIGFGFTIQEEGRHYKLTYCEDPRYVFTLPKTPSDHRSGKNCASDIIRTIF